jgi:outer membrane protein
MKRLVLSVLAVSLAAVVSAQSAPGAAPTVRVAVIDVERLVRDSALGKEAFSRVKKVNDEKKAEADKLQKELRDLEQKLANQGQSLTDDKREQLQKQYQEKAIDFKSFQEKASRDLDQAQKKELADLERRVFPIISQLGKERGFTLIFNKFQSGLVFADDAADITEDLV